MIRRKKYLINEASGFDLYAQTKPLFDNNSQKILGLFGIKDQQDENYKKLYEYLNGFVYDYCTDEKNIQNVNSIVSKRKEAITQHVSLFDKIYRQILLENAIIRQDADTKPAVRLVKISINTDGCAFKTQDGSELTQSDFTAIDNVFKSSLAQKGSLTPGKLMASSATNEPVAAGERGKPEDIKKGLDANIRIAHQLVFDGAIDNKSYDINSNKATNIFKSIKTQLIANNNAGDWVPIAKQFPGKYTDIGKGVALMVYCFILSQCAYATHTTATKETQKAFLNDAINFQASIDFEKIADSCDLPGYKDVVVPPCKLYDIDGKVIATWTDQEDIDDSDDKEKLTNFLSRGLNNQRPAHPQSIAICLALIIKGMYTACELAVPGDVAAVEQSAIDIQRKIDAADNAQLGMAVVTATGAATTIVAPPAGLYIMSVGIGGMIGAGHRANKLQHAKEAIEFIMQIYNKAIELTQKYQAYSLQNLVKVSESKALKTKIGD